MFSCLFWRLWCPLFIENGPTYVATKSCWDWLSFNISSIEINWSKIWLVILNSSNDIPQIKRIHFISKVILKLWNVVCIVLWCVVNAIVIQKGIIGHFFNFFNQFLEISKFTTCCNCALIGNFMNSLDIWIARHISITNCSITSNHYTIFKNQTYNTGSCSDRRNCVLFRGWITGEMRVSHFFLVGTDVKCHCA